MRAIFKQTGDSVDFIPEVDIAAGTVVVQGELVGVSKLDIQAGKLGSLAVSGVFDVSKASGTGTAIAAGAKIYWNETVMVATEDAASGVNKYMGKSTADAADGDETIKVRLSQ